MCAPALTNLSICAKVCVWACGGAAKWRTVPGGRDLKQTRSGSRLIAALKRRQATMIHSTVFQARRIFSLVLICAMLGACASTQKSSTGSGDQAAAPISEASKPLAGAQPDETPGSPSAAATGSSSPSNSAKSADAAGANAGANTGANQGSTESSGVARDNEEAAQLKRQLADQDAQINKLRVEQQAEAEREDAEAAKIREQQTAAAGATEQQPASGTAAAAAAGAKPQDETAVFPANASTAESAGGESAGPRTVERSVYFGYDQATLPDKYDEMLLANAAYLRAHPAVTAEVQGNCDERGSREYNLALGARRAMAVKRALELAGADGSRIAAISYGSEKPVATGKDEESYSRNRRADIVY
jgi:peptidoglycan-associated lipoprotein